MPVISVFYCPRSNSLVRGSNVQFNTLPNEMIEAIGDCPLHKDEKLRVVHYPDRPFSKVSIPEADDIPVLRPPVDAGTVEQPSPMFTEVFWKTVRKALPPEQRDEALEIATVLWEEVLTEPDKAALLSAFASSGSVPYHHSEITRIASTGRSRASPIMLEEAEEATRKNPEQPLKQEDIELEILEHELILGDLLERFELEDGVAAQPLQYNLPMVARIMGDQRYLELLVLQDQQNGQKH